MILPLSGKERRLKKTGCLIPVKRKNGKKIILYKSLAILGGYFVT